MERVGQVSQLVIYPVKSAAGVVVESAICTNIGLQDPKEPYLRDRRWAIMLTTEATSKKIVIGGRQQPRLTLVQPTVKGKTLTLNAPGMPQLQVPIEDSPSDPSQVHTYKMAELDETGEAIDCGDEAAEWFSKHLDKPRVRLIYSPPSMRNRMMKDADVLGLTHQTTKDDDAVAFADLTPYHVLSEGSVADLNSRLKKPVTFNRFRPNILVAGCSAFAEDRWDELHLGQARLRGTWHTPRCRFPNVDPSTGIRDPDKQPSLTLLEYRKGDGKRLDWPGFPIFGRYFLGVQDGIVVVGDEISASFCPSEKKGAVNFLYEAGREVMKDLLGI